MSRDDLSSSMVVSVHVASFVRVLSTIIAILPSSQTQAAKVGSLAFDGVVLSQVGLQAQDHHQHQSLDVSSQELQTSFTMGSALSCYRDSYSQLITELVSE